MTTAPSRPGADRSRHRKGQGQWALGYTEPLNPNERFKKDDDGLNVRQRIVDLYSKQGFDSIDPSDLRGRMRWLGLYTQREQGIPGGLTATLEPEELDAPYFMLRVRIPGGQLTVEQLRAVADISSTYGRDVADITDRQNIQYHWIRIEDVPAIWERLEAVGLNTTEACGDTPRNILGCPLAGLSEHEVLDGTEALRSIESRWIGDPEFSNLPRKFKTSVNGCRHQCTTHEIHDVAFQGVVGPDGTPGFDVWVGGGLSTNPKFGQRLGMFVRPEQVEQVWAGIASVFRDYGYRRSRTRARIKFLMADWGPEFFREVLEQEYLGGAFPDGPAPAAPLDGTRDHVGLTPLRDGTLAVGFTPRTGRTSGTALERLAELAGAYGNGQVRFTAEQKGVVLGVAPERVEELIAALAEIDLLVRPSAFRRGTMACTGIEFCKLAIVNTKGTAHELYTELDRRLPGWETPISINVNGCPNSCARIQVADIGLKGMLLTDAAGGHVEGFQVHLGGRLAGGDASQAAFGRKLRGLRVAAADLPDYIEGLLRAYADAREPGQPFADWVVTAPADVVQWDGAARYAEA
ncbi:MAG TPA: nitrite/sulfite reductase [Frankiaceae bacterium]